MSFLLLTTLLIALITTAKSEQDGIRSVLPNGDYRKTCFACKIVEDRLSCECKDGKWQNVHTEKKVQSCDEFSNDDGELVCTTDFKNRASLPKGKYINTCTNCTFIDDMLKCQCKTDDDKIISTKTSVKKCVEILNKNGHLSCVRSKKEL